MGYNLDNKTINQLSWYFNTCKNYFRYIALETKKIKLTEAKYVPLLAMALKSFSLAYKLFQRANAGFQNMILSNSFSYTNIKMLNEIYVYKTGLYLEKFDGQIKDFLNRYQNEALINISHYVEFLKKMIRYVHMTLSIKN